MANFSREEKTTGRQRVGEPEVDQQQRNEKKHHEVSEDHLK